MARTAGEAITGRVLSMEMVPAMGIERNRYSVPQMKSCTAGLIYCVENPQVSLSFQAPKSPHSAENWPLLLIFQAG
jgi:hypothetical protein